MFDKYEIAFDLEYSACGQCEFGRNDNCQHYFGNGCVNND